MKKRKTTTKARARILAYLAKHGATSQFMLASELGVTPGAVSMAIKQHRESGDAPRLHIASFTKLRSGQWSPQYAVGDGDDMPMPAAYTRGVVARQEARDTARVDLSLDEWRSRLAALADNHFRTCIVQLAI